MDLPLASGAGGAQTQPVPQCLRQEPGPEICVCHKLQAMLTLLSRDPLEEPWPGRQ